MNREDLDAPFSRAVQLKAVRDGMNAPVKKGELQQLVAEVMTPALVRMDQNRLLAEVSIVALGELLKTKGVITQDEVEAMEHEVFQKFLPKSGTVDVPEGATRITEPSGVVTVTEDDEVAPLRLVEG